MQVEDMVETQTPEESEAEDAAFSASFSEARGIEVETPEPAVEAAPAATTEAEPEKAPEATAEAAPAAAPAAEPRLIAGLTEEQIVKALTNAANTQQQLDKVHGRIGSIQQAIEALKAQPRTVADQKAFNIKLDKLKQSFPELAEVLTEDLNNSIVSAVPAQAEPAQPAFTQEELQRQINEGVQRGIQERTQQEQLYQAQRLTKLHPDWQQLLHTPDFQLWRTTIIDDGDDLMASDDARYVANRLTDFKKWNADRLNPQPAVKQPAAAPAAKPAQRLREAVMPTSQAQPAMAPMSEEEAFEASFKKARQTY